MNLLRTTFWTGLATAVRVLTGFVVGKVLAVYIGPVGFAMIGQFQNFVAIVLTFSANLIQNGIVKYIAQFKNEQPEKIKILSTGFVICVASSLLIGILMIAQRNELAVFFLKDKALASVILLFGATLIFYVLNTLITSVMNGEGDIRRLTLTSMSGSILGLILTCFLASRFHLIGALIALVIGQSFIFAVALLFILKAPFFRLKDYLQGFDYQYGKKLFQFALMAVTSGLTLPVVQLAVRQYIAHTLSWQDAGFWQAVTRISDAYLLLITSTISVYYLPRFSTLRHPLEFKKEIHHAYRYLLPAVSLIALVIFVLKSWVIHILFAPSFAPMAPLFAFQLLGDVFKIGAWIISYNMLARAMTGIFIVSEIIFGLSFGLFVMVFVPYFQLRGVTLAFAVNYLLYWLFMWQFVYKRIVRPA